MTKLSKDSVTDYVALQQRENKEVALRTSYFVRQTQKTTKDYALIRKAVKAGLRLEVEGNTTTIDIDVSDLTFIYEVVGTVEAEGKQLVDNFDLTEEQLEEHDNWIWVYVRPTDNEWSGLTFRYLKPLEDGVKCHVEEHTSTNTYKSLVCDVE